MSGIKERKKKNNLPSVIMFGMIALKRSNRFVLMLGVVLMGCSMAGMMLSASYLGLLLSLGILFGLGAGALAFGLILTSAIHFVGREHAMIISGMLNAAAGMVGFILSPVLQSLLQARGLVFTLTAMIGIVAALIPAAVIITSRDSAELPDEAEEEESASGESGICQPDLPAFICRIYHMRIPHGDHRIPPVFAVCVVWA